MRSFLAAVFVVLFVAGGQAQTPPAPTPVRVAGTVDKLDGDTLSVKSADGQTTMVTLAADAAIYGVEKRTLADIKPGDFVASGGIKGTDGKIHAVEVRIFPEPLRGTGEGQRPWAAKPDGMMTNATVGTVTQSPDGGVIHVTYKEGESEYIVGPDVPVLAYVVADRSLLKPGAAVLIFAQKQPDGTLTTKRVTAEKDGIKPPM
jgi:hypothetical protein